MLKQKNVFMSFCQNRFNNKKYYLFILTVYGEFQFTKFMQDYNLFENTPEGKSLFHDALLIYNKYAKCFFVSQDYKMFYQFAVKFLFNSICNLLL